MWWGGYSFEHSSAPVSDPMDSSQQIHEGQGKEEEAIDPSFTKGVVRGEGFGEEALGFSSKP